MTKKRRSKSHYTKGLKRTNWSDGRFAPLAHPLHLVNGEVVGCESQSPQNPRPTSYPTHPSQAGTRDDWLRVPVIPRAVTSFITPLFTQTTQIFIIINKSFFPPK